MTGSIIPVNALSLNANDQVVGNYNPSGQGILPFIYSPSTGLNAIAGFNASSNATATGINNAGLIVGNDPNTGNGFVYNGSAVTEVAPASPGTLTFSGINNNGLAVGASTTGGGASQVVTYGTVSHVFTNVGAGFTGASGTSFASGINDAGQVLGVGIANASASSSSAHYQPFLATPVAASTSFNYTNVGNAVEPIVNLYGAAYPYFPAPQSIDQQGNVAGTEAGATDNSYPSSFNSSPYGYFYNTSNGTATLVQNQSPFRVLGMADVAGSPEIVGTAYEYNPATFSHEFDAFAYYNGTFTDLAHLVSGVLLGSANSVNSNGDILATGSNASGASLTFLLTVQSATVKYTGTVSNNWDTTSNNFTPSLYADGYGVVFDDTATGSTTINIPSTVAPAGVTFNNSSKSYVISGAGITGGASSYLNVTGHGTVTLNNGNTYAGVTNVSSGTLIVGSTGVIASTSVIVAAGGTLRVESGGVLTASQTSPQSLALTIGGTVSLDNYGTGTQTMLGVSGLSLAGSTNAWTGKLDLSNNDLIGYRLNLAQVTNQVKAGFANGTWQGSGGVTSSAAAANTTHLTALGVIQNTVDQTVNGSTLYSTFNGVSVYSGNLLVSYTYYGDANLDGQVDASDYSLIDSGYLTHATGWYNGDFNYDGVINGSDYTLIDNAYNSQGGNLGGGANDDAEYATSTAEIADVTQTSAVPEPATLGLLSVAVLGMLGRRRPLPGDIHRPSNSKPSK